MINLLFKTFSLIGLILGVTNPCVAAITSRSILIEDELDRFEQHAQIVSQQLDELSSKIVNSSVIFNDHIHTFDINTRSFYYHYTQKGDSILEGRKNSGVWEGVAGQYTFRPLYSPLINYLSLEAFYATGKLQINRDEVLADRVSNTKLIVKNVPGYMFDSRLLLGKDIIPRKSLRLTPYSGFGISYYTDHSAGHSNILKDQTTDILGFNRSDLLYYIPIGLTIDLAANRGCEFSLNTEYDHLVKGYERYDYANFDQFTLPLAGFTNSNYRFSQDHGYGLRFSLKLLKHFSWVDAYLEPYVRYWHIKASKSASGIYNDPAITAQPVRMNVASSSTLEIGSKIGVQF